MGILNVTEDSFHAASRVTLDEAVERGQAMWAAGADWVDVGAESTRPGAGPVDLMTELSRVSRVISSLRAANPDGWISVDTRHVAVAEAGLEMGADMINDVSGLRDPAMRQLVVDQGCAVCIMHMQGEPQTMQAAPAYEDVVGEVAAHVGEAVAWLVERGVSAARIVLDPGIGFGKTLEHNLALMSEDAVAALRGEARFPLLWGTSRKSMFRALLGRESSDDRLTGTLGTAAHAMALGVELLRVHDVEPHDDLLRTLVALRG